MSGTSAAVRLAVEDIRTAGPRRLTDELESHLRSAIREGRLRDGVMLPSSRSLAADLGVSRGVVVRAYEQLVAEGYLRARQGLGTLVESPPPVPSARTTPAAPVTRFHPPNPGRPELRWFPRSDWGDALDLACRSAGSGDLDYGDPRGHPRLREVLADHLGRTRSVVADPDAIIVTTGYAQGIRAVGQALREAGVDRVAMEDPGSIGVLATLVAAGQSIEPVEVDAAGLVVDDLDRSGARAVVVTPAHQFPTGVVLAPGRRRDLLAWASRHDGLVIEDDYDAEYRYDRAPVGSLQGLAPDRVIHGGSVSKTIAPGLRLGWLLVPPALTDVYARAKFFSDAGTSVLDQLALARFIESGAMDRHVRRTTQGYARRRAALLEAVTTLLPDWQVTGVSAGLYALLLPADPDEPIGRTTGHLDVVPLDDYHHGDRDGPRRGLVVGYGNATVDRIHRGITELARRP